MKKKHKKIYKKESLNSAMYIIKCPECGNIVASASERCMLPEFSTCDNEKCKY